MSNLKNAHVTLSILGVKGHTYPSPRPLHPIGLEMTGVFRQWCPSNGEQWHPSPCTAAPPLNGKVMSACSACRRRWGRSPRLHVRTDHFRSTPRHLATIVLDVKGDRLCREGRGANGEEREGKRGEGQEGTGSRMSDVHWEGWGRVKVIPRTWPNEVD